MYNHEPKNYHCPFCQVISGVEDETIRSRQGDVFYKDESITAFISSDGWPNNPGHALIVTNRHVENIYDLPDELSAKVHAFEKKLAIAMKEVYKPDGISSRQHNEPAGGQDVSHYHLHVFPRFVNDQLYELTMTGRKLTPPQERAKYAQRMREYFAQNK